MRRSRALRQEPIDEKAESVEVDADRAPVAVRSTESVRWSLLAVVGRQASQMFCALVLARLLGPATYGVISAATVYVTFTTLLLDQGLAAALVQRKTLSRVAPGAVATVNLLAGVLLSLLTWIAAPYVADFFSAPQAASLLRVLGFGLLIKAAAVTPRAMQQRALAFRTIGLADIAGGVVGAVAGISAGLMGSGVWSMAYQVITTDLVISVALISVSRGTLPNLKIREVRPMLPFSLRVFGGNLLAFLSRNSDNILIGRFLGVGALSLYSMAYRVLVIPVQMIGQTVNRVSFPIFARLADDQERLARSLLRTIGLLSFAAVPAMGFVAVASHELIALVLGPRWEATAPVLTILAVAGARETVFSATQSVMRAKGAGKTILRYEILATTTQVAGIVVGLRFGVVGVAAGITLAGFALSPVMMAIQRRLTGVGIGAQFGCIWPPVHASLWAALSYVAIGFTPWPAVAQLVVGAMAFLLITLIVLWLVHRKALMSTLTVGAEILGIRRASPHAP